MKNNTIITIADQNYFWGVFLLVASMRRVGMDEPIRAFHTGFTPEMQRLLLLFDDVSVHELAPNGQSLTCRKAEAMLSADTEFVTWVDSDGFFTGNVSDVLPPAGPGHIHVRLRVPEENDNTFRAFGLYKPEDPIGSIPSVMLNTWQADIRKMTGAACDKARNATCASACVLSVHRGDRAFLEAWKTQMETILPRKNVGVVDHSQMAYRQLDESVLNSLLCFDEKAPAVESTFRLNKNPQALFRHVVGIPKPWEWWNSYTYGRFYTDIMKVFDYARSLNLPGIKIPMVFDRRYAWVHKYCQAWALKYRIMRRLRRYFPWM